MTRKITGSAIVDAAGGPGSIHSPAVDQPSMFEEGSNPGCGETGAGDLAGGFALTGAGGERGPGRPAGAKNVRDTKMVELIQRQYGSPLDALGKLYQGAADPIAMWLRLKKQATTAEIAGEDFNLTVKDCIDLVIRAALAALPYLEKKQPVAVEFTSDAQPVVFNIKIGNVNVGLSEARANRILEGEVIDDPELTAALDALELPQ